MLDKRVPCRHRSARQRRGFLERQVGGQLDHAVLLEHGVFPEHSIDGAAERAEMSVGARRAADPALKKTSRYPLADFDASYTGADLDHFPGTVGERHEVWFRRHSVAAQSDGEVAIVERTGCDLDQHLTRAWLESGKLGLDESVDAGALWQLIGPHPSAPPSLIYFGLILIESLE